MWIHSNEVDETGAYYTEWSKSERKTPVQYTNTYMEKAMAPHSSTLAWEIPWMEEPGRLQSMGSLRVGHDWATALNWLNYFTIFWWFLLYISAKVVHVSPCLKLPSHLPPHPIPLGCTTAIALSALFHASNLDWSSISHTLIYIFQCYSLKSSHPRLVP